MLKEIKYQSNDNITEITAYSWVPDGKVNAILQIEHGMVEHMRRYDKIAEIFNNAGILVCGADHLGHGESTIDEDHLGYFAAVKGHNVLIEDSHNLTLKMKEEYPNTPIFLLGHSFGSFLVRNYMYTYENDINGVVIMGSAYHKPCKMNLAIILTAIHQFYHRGWFYRSKLLKKLTVGKFHRYFDEEDEYCWLTRNKDILEAYKKDPKCQFRFTCNGYLNMFRLIKNSCKKGKLKKMNKRMPIYVISGKDDPVGNFGKGVQKVFKFYQKAKFSNVKIKLYNNMRHEILSEPERVIVINDITAWINSNLLKAKN